MLHSPRHLTLACALSGLAGYVDGIGFLHLGGLFVSFMSGNSTRLGVSLAEGNGWRATEAMGLIVFFVAGATSGSLIALSQGAHRQALVLLVEALLLAIAALLYAAGLSNAAISAIVLAMGMENAVFQVHGGAAIGLTYVTGTLVKVGQLLASALRGGARWSWIPNLLLWAALVLGSVFGALAYHWINLAAIWFAAGFTSILCAISVFLTPPARPSMDRVPL